MSATQLAAREVGDGNLNLVFIVVTSFAPITSLVLKQALPYVRMVGESWPLSVDRNRYEHRALAEYSRIVPDLIPRVYHVDDAQALFIMEDLSRLVVARRGMIARRPYPRLARDIARFAAETVVRTSDFYLPSADKKALVARFVMNTDLCKITEDLVLNQPFVDAPENSFEDELRPDVERLWQDEAARVAVERLRRAFVSRSEGLLHGDLHTGSILAGADETRVFDAEFAVGGPFGFDIGMFIANLYLSALSHLIQAADSDQRAYGHQVLRDALVAWAVFSTQMDTLLASASAWTLLPAARAELLQQTLRDLVGFAGAEMIRRTIGMARVADLEGIADRETRVRAKSAALKVGRTLLAVSGSLDRFEDAHAAVARRIEQYSTPGAVAWLPD